MQNSFLYALLTEVAKVVLILAVLVAAALFRGEPLGHGPRDLTQAERQQ